MFENTHFDGHERVIHHYDEETGLRAIIAIHSTSLGPAGGGCRLWQYTDEYAALSDALNLSRGMSYKNALAGLRMGGGKAVILGPVSEAVRSRSFQAFGRAVDSLAGAYVTAEDVGVRVEDMKEVAKATRFVSGLSDKGGAGGDPSPYTAKGVTLGIEASVKHALDRTSIEGLTVAVQGLGGVGGNLAQELSKRGARLLVADVDPQKVEAVCDLLGAEPVSVSDVLYEEVDIVAPCALGGAITEEVASKLQARVIAGGANNQIATARAGQILMKRGVTYAPDYVINSGGIILVAAEYFGDNCGDQVQTAIDLIYGRTLNILDRSRASSRFSGDVADEMARAVITAAASGREASVSSSFVAV